MRPRRVLDVPEPPPWLGWLAVPAALAFYVVGIGLYCVWAYRRGKHDGFGAHTELAPSEQIGWATVGWSLALFVPILNWYALVHLPTMWYKRGRVVGASSDTAPSHSFTSVLAFVPVLATAVLIAGGVLIADSLSDGDGQAGIGPAYEGGPVVCDALESRSFTYSLDAVIDIDNPDILPVPTGVTRGPPDTVFTTHVEAEVEDGDRISATITNDDGFTFTTFGAIVAEGAAYTQFDNREWQQRDLSFQPVPYRLLGLCNAIGLDLELGPLTGTRDEAIASQKFEIDSLAMDFPSLTRDLVGGDVDTLIEAFDVTVWVAEQGSYISKVDLIGTGFYGDETSLTFHLSYEISDMGGDINVDIPI